MSLIPGNQQFLFFHGINIYSDASQVQLTKTHLPPTHHPLSRAAHRTPAPQIVFYQQDYGRQLRDILNGTVDAGFIQSGWIEANHPEAIPHLLFHNLSRAQYQSEAYPFALSTDLIPTYGLSAAPAIPWALRETIAQALMRLNRSHPAAASAGVSKFTVPGDYGMVGKIVEHVGILYRDARANARCYDSWGNLDDLVTCAPGYVRDRLAPLDQSCAAPGLPCPQDLTCVCRPCVPKKDTAMRQAR